MLKKKSPGWRRTNIDVPVSVTLAVLPKEYNVVVLQHSPDGQFLYTALYEAHCSSTKGKLLYSFSFPYEITAINRFRTGC